MGTYCVRKSDGSDANTGADFQTANVLATVAGASSKATSAGDRIWMSQAHDESQTTAMTIGNAAGTADNPTQIWCGDDTGGDLPSTPIDTPTAKMTVTNANGITVNGNVDMRGAILTSAANIQFNGSANRLRATNLILTNTSSGYINLQGDVRAEKIGVRFGFAGAYLRISGTIGTRIRLRDVTALASGTSPTAFLTFNTGGLAADILVDVFDFTNWNTALALVSTTSLYPGQRIIFRGGKLPNGWTENIVGSNGFTTTVPGCEVLLESCSAGSVHYPFVLATYWGTVSEDTSVYQSSAGGLADGGVGWSLKMKMHPSAATTRVRYPGGSLISPKPFVIRNATVGSPINIEFPFVHDSASDLTDADFGVLLHYLDDSSSMHYAITGGLKADPLASAAAHATDSVSTWAGTSGFSNVRKQKVVFTGITPQRAGPILAYPILAKATNAYTVYCNGPMVS